MSKIKEWSLCLPFLLMSFSISCQDVFSDINQLQHIRAITYEKGQDFKHWVNDIILDDDGLMWISSYNLLYTFDGNTITERAMIENNYSINFNKLFKIKDTLYLKNNTSDIFYFSINSPERIIKKARWNIDYADHYTTTNKREILATTRGILLEYKEGRFDTIFKTVNTNAERNFNPSQKSMISDKTDNNLLWYYHKNKLHHVNLSNGTAKTFHCKEEANLDLNYTKPHRSYQIGLTQIGNNLFFGSFNKGLIRFHIPTRKWKSFTREVPNEYIGREDYINSVLGISAINDSILLLGGTFAPFFNVKNEKQYQYLGSDREHRLIKHGSSIFHDGIFFLNNFNGGISILSHENNKFSNFHNYDVKEFSTQVSDSNGLSWSSDGLNMYSVNSSNDTLRTINAIETFNEEISNNLLVDQDQFIWIGSSTGLIKFNFEHGSYKKYTEFDGLPGEDWINEFSARINNEGVVLITAEKLSTVFEPSLLNKDDIISKPFVNQVTILDKIYSGIKENELTLKPEENFFNIQFSCKNYKADPLSLFEYKLDGYDKRWLKSNNEKNVSYNNLDPGIYNFKIRVTNQEGNQSEISKDFKIRIKAHWYQSLLFKLALLLIISAIAFAFYHIKTGSLKRELNLRSRFNDELSQVKLEALRSQMNPHFLFNCLNSIDSFILSNDSQKASEYLGKFSKLIRNILDFSKTNAITLSQELESIEIYIKMEQMRFDEKFDYEINVNKSIDQSIKSIPPLILQPYVENSIWHGLLHKDEKGTIVINIESEDGYYIIEIDDNGIGRKKALAIKTKSAIKRKSHGMKITEERIRLINQLNGQGGTVETIDKTDKYGYALGTRVILKLPMSLKF